MYLSQWCRQRVHMGSFAPNPCTCAPILCMTCVVLFTYSLSQCTFNVTYYCVYMYIDYLHGIVPLRLTTIVTVVIIYIATYTRYSTKSRSTYSSEGERENSSTSRQKDQLSTNLKHREYRILSLDGILECTTSICA